MTEERALKLLDECAEQAKTIVHGSIDDVIMRIKVGLIVRKYQRGED